MSIFERGFQDFYDVIVVIGHSNDFKGELSNVAIDRLSKGIELFERGMAPYILLTSGRGKGFNATNKAHSEWAKKELLSRLPLTPQRVITETKSRSTIENALLAKTIIDARKWQKIIVVTSGYHIPRTKMIFRRVFSRSDYELKFVKARTNGLFFWISHRLKEMVLKHRNKRELKQLLASSSPRHLEHKELHDGKAKQHASQKTQKAHHKKQKKVVERGKSKVLSKKATTRNSRKNSRKS